MATDAMPKIGQAKVTSRMQITIPVKVQKALGGIETGEFLVFYQHEDGILVKSGIVTNKDNTQDP